MLHYSFFLTLVRLYSTSIPASAVDADRVNLDASTGSTQNVIPAVVCGQAARETKKHTQKKNTSRGQDEG